MKLSLILISLLVLSACGADGPPERPTMNAAVVISSSGVSVSPSVGVKLGAVNLRVGL